MDAPSEESFYYYKGVSFSKRRYYSVDGKKMDSSKLTPQLLMKIKEYPDIYSFVDLKMSHSKKEEELGLLCTKVDLYQKVLEYFGALEFRLDEHAAKQVYYWKERKGKKEKDTATVYDYRFYICAAHFQRLAEMGVIKNARSKLEKRAYPSATKDPAFSPEDVSPFHEETAERFSQWNILRKYEEKIAKLQKRITLLKINIESSFHKINASPYRNISLSDIHRVQKERETLIQQYLAFIGEKSQPKKEIKPNARACDANDLLVQLKITDKRSFWVWMKANHPDKHQGSPDIQQINAVFARALQAARAKGYM